MSPLLSTQFMRRTRRRRLIPRQPLMWASGVMGLMQPGIYFIRYAWEEKWHFALPFLGMILLMLGGLWWAFRKAAREPKKHRITDVLRASMTPRCFCLGCGTLVSTQPACQRCGVALSIPAGTKVTCKKCRSTALTAEEFRQQGKVWLCYESVIRLRSAEVQPTWVVGVLRASDFQRLRELPGAECLTVEDVPLVYLPPEEGNDLALCAINMEELPETGKVGSEHALTGMHALWLGSGGNRLDTHRVLDRLEYLTGLTPQELRNLEMLTEEADPEPAVREVLARRLGTLLTGVTLEALRACRPEGLLPQTTASNSDQVCANRVHVADAAVPVTAGRS